MSNFNIINLEAAKNRATGNDGNGRGLISFSLSPTQSAWFNNTRAASEVKGILKNKPKFSITAEYTRLIDMDESFTNINKGLNLIGGRGLGFSKGWSRKIYKGGSYLSLSLQTRIIDNVLASTSTLSSYCSPSKDNEKETAQLDEAQKQEMKTDAQKEREKRIAEEVEQEKKKQEGKNKEIQDNYEKFLYDKYGGNKGLFTPYKQYVHDKVAEDMVKRFPKYERIVNEDKSKPKKVVAEQTATDQPPQSLVAALWQGALNYAPPICWLEIGNYFSMEGFYVKSVDWEYSHEQNAEGPLYADVNIELENFEIKISEDIINSFKLMG